MNDKQKVINRLTNEVQYMVVRCPNCNKEYKKENDGSEGYKQALKDFHNCEMTCDKCGWFGLWEIDFEY